MDATHCVSVCLIRYFSDVAAALTVTLYSVDNILYKFFELLSLLLSWFILVEVSSSTLLLEWAHDGESKRRTREAQKPAINS